MRLEAIDPQGRSTTLFSVPQYQFKNRWAYQFEKPLLLKAGTTLRATAIWDNSETNPWGFDAKREIHWGPDPEKDEMFDMHLWLFQASGDREGAIWKTEAQ